MRIRVGLKHLLPCLFSDAHNEFVFYLLLKLMKRNLHNVKRMTSHPVHQYCKCFTCDPEHCKWPLSFGNSLIEWEILEL